MFPVFDMENRWSKGCVGSLEGMLVFGSGGQCCRRRQVGMNSTEWMAGSERRWNALFCFGLFVIVFIIYTKDNRDR
jgi:hypothetical protein